MISLPVPAVLFLAGFLFAAGVTFGYMLCGTLMSAAAECEPAEDDVIDAELWVIEGQPKPGMWL